MARWCDHLDSGPQRSRHVRPCDPAGRAGMQAVEKRAQGVQRQPRGGGAKQWAGGGGDRCDDSSGGGAMTTKPRACRRRRCGGCPRCEPDGRQASRGWHGHPPAGVYRPACEGRRAPLRGGVCTFVGGALSDVCPWPVWGAACQRGWRVHLGLVERGALTWARRGSRAGRFASSVGSADNYSGAMKDGFRPAAEAFSRPRPRVNRTSLAALAVLLGGGVHAGLGAVEVHPDPKRGRRR